MQLRSRRASAGADMDEHHEGEHQQGPQLRAAGDPEP